MMQPQGCNLRCSAMRRKAFICSGSFASIDRSFAKALGVLCVQHSGGKPFTGEKWQLENVCQVGSFFHETLLSLTFSWRFWKIQTSQTPGIWNLLESWWLYILYHFLFRIPPFVVVDELLQGSKRHVKKQKHVPRTSPTLLDFQGVFWWAVGSCDNLQNLSLEEPPQGEKVG